VLASAGPGGGTCMRLQLRCAASQEPAQDTP